MSAKQPQEWTAIALYTGDLDYFYLAEFNAFIKFYCESP